MSQADRRARAEAARRCRWPAEQLAAYACGELPERAAEKVRRHLDQCPVCRARVEEIRRSLEALRGLGEADVPEGLDEAIIAAVRAAPPPEAIARRARLWRAGLSLAGAAAAVLVAVILWPLIAGPPGSRFVPPHEAAAARGPQRRPPAVEQRVEAMPREAPTAAAEAVAGAQRARAAGEQVAAAPEAAPAGGPAGRQARAAERAVQVASREQAKARRGRAGGAGRQKIGGRPGPKPGIKPKTAVGPALEAAPHAASAEPRQPPPPEAPAAEAPSPAPETVQPLAAASAPGTEKAEMPSVAAPPTPETATAMAPRAGAAAKSVAAGAGAPAAEALKMRGGPVLLGGPRREALPAKPVAAVETEQWLLRVSHRPRSKAGSQGSIGLHIEAHSELYGVTVRAVAEDGAPLGESVHVQAVRPGQPVVVSVPFKIDKPGTHRLKLIIEAREPALATELALTAVVEPADSRHKGLVSAAFQGVPLAEAAATIARQAGVEVEVDPELAGREVNADFTGGVDAKAALQALAEQVGAKLVEEDGKFAIKLPGEQP